jgi:hypothetical protein
MHVVQDVIQIFKNYNISTQDADVDDLSYYIDWGDNTTTEWIGPYNSGTEITQTHKWTDRSNFTIKAKAKDENGAESDWTELAFSTPKTKATYPNFQNILSILRNILSPCWIGPLNLRQPKLWRTAFGQPSLPS